MRAPLDKRVEEIKTVRQLERLAGLYVRALDDSTRRNTAAEVLRHAQRLAELSGAPITTTNGS
jgi:hypothetical protein